MRSVRAGEPFRLRSRCSLGHLYRIPIPRCRSGGVGPSSISCERIGVDDVPCVSRIHRIEQLLVEGVGSPKQARSFLGLRIFDT